jgi:hypothetical protein
MKNCHNWKDKSEVMNVNTSLSLEDFIKLESDKLKGE